MAQKENVFRGHPEKIWKRKSKDFKCFKNCIVNLFPAVAMIAGRTVKELKS